MKVLMVLETEFPPDRRVENEASSLLKAGHNVTLLCLSRKENSTGDYKGITLIKYKIPKFIYKSSVGALKFPFYFNFWKKIIRKVHTRNRFDVIHIHDLPLIKPVYELKEKFGYKIILDLHENWPGLLNISPHTKTLAGRILCSIEQWRQYERKYIEKSDAIIVVIKEASERISKLSTRPLNINIVSNTIKIPEIEPADKTLNKKTGKTTFIYEGGITYHRGLQYVIKAFSCLPEKVSNKSELWIIGKGSYLKEIQNLTKELNVPNIVFWGWQPQSKVYELLSKSDIALIPHIKSEHTDSTIPHKLFHYLYAGIPILASDCKPIERIIEETNSGIIYRYNDINDLSHKLIRLVEDPQQRDIFSDSKRWVEKKYNWSTDERILTDLYKNI